MRQFNSYGPINDHLHYYALRHELIDKGFSQLVGENLNVESHYITVWAPRHSGRTWVMQEIVKKIKQKTSLPCGIITMERAKNLKDEKAVVEEFAISLSEVFHIEFPSITEFRQIPLLFTHNYFKEPVILIIDEFDSLEENFINAFAGIFRDIYMRRSNEIEKNGSSKTYLLHSLGLIGVRSVLGIENEKGSPFNVQRSLRIPNLTYEEVNGMFKWYEKDSGQKVEQEVIDMLYDETRGQPGLTCWFGELLTKGCDYVTPNPNQSISASNFKEVLGAAINFLPNNNILNLISKVKTPPYDEIVMELFRTEDKVPFNFDNKDINYLYMNGVVSEERVNADEFYLRFSSPFVQKRIFNYFSNRFFSYMGQLTHPLDDMKDAIDEETLCIPNIIKRYQAYLKKNKGTFFRDVPRRKTDLKIYEAIYHFNLFRYLYDLLRDRGVEVIPQFPTGNGKIDLILKYHERVYAIELKSFKNMYTFEKGIGQAADYGRKLGLTEIVYLVFVELTEEEASQLNRVTEVSGVRVTVLTVGIL